jgi:formylglycine-generating enzyme required for sulfatase activity
MTNVADFSSREQARLWRSDDDTPLMVELPAGEFIMGETRDDKFTNDTERPAHVVVIPSGISLGKFPVTVGEFNRFRHEHAPEEDEMLPVVRVSWHEARAYCDWLTERTGCSYHLPTEAEWEFACRGGSQGIFGFGDDITTDDANFLYDENGFRVGVGRRLPVGSYQPNPFGVHDLHGNVCEWVEDSWHPNYLAAPADGRAWVTNENRHRVIRGGAWDYLPRLLRCAWRDWRLSTDRADNIGFRVASGHMLGGGGRQ